LLEIKDVNKESKAKDLAFITKAKDMSFMVKAKDLCFPDFKAKAVMAKD